METIKINNLEIENTKRVKAVKLEPSKNGLTVIGGRNKQGKTSVIDSIAWVLGGNKYAPSEPQREGSTIPPHLKVELSDGTIVERAGKNSSLKVIDPSGNKGGQKLLDSFIEQLALDLPKFMEASNKEKANILLQIIGVGEQLAKFEKEEQEVYNERFQIGRIADQKEKFAKEQVFYTEAPKTLVSAKELIEQQQMILAQNGENQRKRDNVVMIEYKEKQLAEEIRIITEQLVTKKQEHEKLKADLAIAKMDTLELHDQSTEELEHNIDNVEQINIKVRANLDKEKAEDDAQDYKNQYDALTIRLNEIRMKKTDLLNCAELPLPDLSVKDGELTYKGQKWDNMSGSERMMVSTSIIRKLNPKCGFVLLDKLEQMDIETMREFGNWLEQEGLQAIATRVSTGDECSIIIEDGYILEGEKQEPTNELNSTQFIPTHFGEEPDDTMNGQKIWKAGEF